MVRGGEVVALAGDWRPERIVVLEFESSDQAQGYLIPMSNQKAIFVILSAAKNLSFKAAEILHSAALRSE
ncbi:MAG: DUF1330 domain-containing protein [Deltaproteobacteria bacterium]|nr:DUF1330 domain-containing protein [Deltaproteobacteria bacterium]